jgi:hypothetical protein
MDNISNGLGFGSSSSDPKAAVMNQVRQEAAMTNARQLIEVRLLHHCLCPPLTASRKLTSTVSRSAYPNLAPHYRAERRHASRNAWRSIWRHGTLFQDSISTGYNRSRGEVLVEGGSSKFFSRKESHTMDVRIGPVTHMWDQMGGKVCIEWMGGYRRYQHESPLLQ